MEGPDRLRVSWSLPSVPGPLVGDGFLLRLWDGARGQERRENVSSPQARTALLTGLTPGTHYQLDVRLYHCIPSWAQPHPLLVCFCPPAVRWGGSDGLKTREDMGRREHRRPRRTWEVIGAWMDVQRALHVKTWA